MAAQKRASKKATKAVATPAPRAGKPRAAAASATKKAPVKRAGASAKKRPTASSGAARAPAPRTPAAKRSAPARPPASAAEVAPSAHLGEGDRAPSFTLQDHRGQTLSSRELAGSPYVLYFYPKDDTPGCTTQACGFRDAAGDFEGARVRVIGVSPDSVASHQRFASKHGLPFTLLSDPEQALASRYGVWALKKNYGREYMGIVRSTFLVDAEGVIRKAWRGVRVNGHVADVHAAAAALAQ